MTYSSGGVGVGEFSVKPATSVSLDTLQRALRAVDMAKQLVEQIGSDQFSMTFLQEDGSLGGRVSLTNGKFFVDFSLLGQPASTS